MPEKKHEAHVAKEKKEVVSRLKKLIDEHKVVAAVDVENLPAKQLMNMRSQLRGKAYLLMSKKRLISIALDEAGKEGLSELKKHLKGMPALLFSNDNPFALYKLLKKNKSPAPIKAGQTTPKDIVVKAGGTGFAPGPVIGELGAFGIKAGVEGGKVAIKEDKVVAKEGEQVSAKLAGLLQRLDIQPMEIGLNLVAAYEDGDVLGKDVLDIDEEAFMTQLKGAASDAFKLTIGVSLPLKENIELLLGKAQMEAIALADTQSILTKDTINRLLGKAEAHAEALKDKI